MPFVTVDLSLAINFVKFNLKCKLANLIQQIFAATFNLILLLNNKKFLKILLSKLDQIFLFKSKTLLIRLLPTFTENIKA